MFLLATSNGDRGAKQVLEIAHSRISRGNPYQIPTFSLPNFEKNFTEEEGILNKDIKNEFEKALSLFISNVN